MRHFALSLTRSLHAPYSPCTYMLALANYYVLHRKDGIWHGT